MPDPTLSQAIKEAYASAPCVPIYDTLEISHSAFTQSIYVVRDNADLTAHLETGAEVTFIRFAFDIKKPELSPDGVPQCEVEIDNVSREILANVQLAVASTEPIKITYRQYLSSDLSGPQNNPPMVLTVSSIKATIYRITATAGYGDLTNKRLGTDYTDTRFPSLAS